MNNKMSVVCEEVFDETSHPSVEEIKDYASKIGIDPDSEPHLLPLAAEGLMKALPPDWKPCFDDNSKSYYYYNNLTKKTQWEHPLDDVYRGLVKKVRAESQSLSLNDPTEDATRDDIPSFEESPYNISALPPKKLEPIPPVSLGARKKDIKLSPLKSSTTNISPKHEKISKQKSEEYPIEKRKITLTSFSSFDNEVDSGFDKHPRSLLDKGELKLNGGGSMFLKSNTKKQTDIVPATSKADLLIDLQPRSILRERTSIEHSKSMEFEKLSLLDKSDKDDDDKKSVRFNLENTDIGITFSDKSSSEEDINSDRNKAAAADVNFKIGGPKSRFTISLVPESTSNLKLIKPNPTDFIKPKLTISRGSDSEDDSLIKSFEKGGKNNIDSFFDSDNSLESPLNENFRDKSRKIEEKAERKINLLKQNIWEEKNDELMKFRSNLKESHKGELERILIEEKIILDQQIKTELQNLRTEMENRTKGTLKEEKLKLEEKLKQDVATGVTSEEEKLKKHFEVKKEELERYYEEKLADIEKDLAEKVEKSRDETLLSHNATLEQLRQNHAVVMEEVKRELLAEEQVLRQEHQVRVAEFKSKTSGDPERTKAKEDRLYEKLRCEKRLLEDKYQCLKDKYARLKADVKLEMEKRTRRKEKSGGTTTTNTTGSETEQSNSNNKDNRTPLHSPSHKLLDKPPTPKHHHTRSNNNQDPSNRIKPEHRTTKQVLVRDLDTSTSDAYQSDTNKNDKDSSDSTNPGRNRKKIFSRLKSSSTSRINNNLKSRKPPRSCSPVENLRRQLQKLEDLEDQFPQNPQSDTYHLRYPFSDGGHKFEGSSELEFFRHRIHLERDSIKRAKESLRSQRSLFQQRQKELKLKHGSMARHTLQQLCQEEKEITDMEVSLHRTRSLLGEKVIRLRHLEQSLQRANITNEQPKNEDATLSDISSHSASSGISSTEFATADANFGKVSMLRRDHLQESSEIIQSLENLNSEIREIWDVLRTQQQQSSIATVMPPLLYPDLGWPILAGAASLSPAPPSIPTLADRLHNYRQHVALANAQSTVVTHANQGATTTLVERTRNLRHWLRQTGIDGGVENTPPQASL